MVLRHDTTDTGQRRTAASREEAAFRLHLAVYLLVGLLLFSLELLTSPFNVWFSWPLFFWGWTLALHTAVAFGTDAPARVPRVLRSLARWDGEVTPAWQGAMIPALYASPFTAEAFAAVHNRLERLNGIAWRISDSGVCGRVDALGAEAEHAIAAMARDRVDAASARRFESGVFAPVVALFEHYGAAASHGATRADEAPRRIVERDLPLVMARLRVAPDRAPSSPPGNPVRN